jgi:hypothetical protein
MQRQDGKESAKTTQAARLVGKLKCPDEFQNASRIVLEHFQNISRIILEINNGWFAAVCLVKLGERWCIMPVVLQLSKKSLSSFIRGFFFKLFLIHSPT